MSDLGPEVLHAHLLERAPRILRFDREAYFPEWQSAVRRSFRQLLGLMPARVPAELRIVSDERVSVPVAHRAIRFVFRSEPRVDVACVLLIPDDAVAPHPTLIILQDDRTSCGGEREALHHGYAVLQLDMRGSGERAGSGKHDRDHAAHVALLLGRTMMGENVCDIMRLMDVLAEHFPEVDMAHIGISGQGAAGAAAYYAGAVEPRIGAVIAGGAVCSYAASIGTIEYTPEHYLPNILHYFEMSDLAGLIVPRPLLILAGENERRTPIGGVRECYAEIEEIYASQQASGACRLVMHSGADGSAESHWRALEEVWHWRQANDPVH